MVASQIQCYNNFLAGLVAQHTKVLHFITYRKNKINGMAFEDVLKQNTFLPSCIECSKVLICNDEDKYINYKNNVHHWTTSYCWNSFIPMLMENLDIKIDILQFEEIPYIWNKCNFSYHRMNGLQFKISDFNGNTLTGNHDVLRCVNDCPTPVLSMYHSLFRLSHQSGKISSLNGRPILSRVVVNCDSMAIPVIPILACYCKDMLVIDNRTGKNFNFSEIALQFHPTHYISLFTEENFLFNAKHMKNLE